MTQPAALIRIVERESYHATWHNMQQFTHQRHENTLDEIWIVEHAPVFTQGQNGKSEHIIDPKDIPVIQVDRGGQVTYHGPGQLVAYTLIDIKRKKLNVREIINLLLKSVIALLSDYGIKGTTQCAAPGVFVDDKKICSIGLRVRRGCTFHGLAFNVAMDLEPFSRIHPCGFSDLKMTQLADFYSSADIIDTRNKLITHLVKNLGYNNHHILMEKWYGTKSPE